MRLRILPILLIAIGLGVLLGNLGVIPAAEVREFFRTWWPLLLIGFGTAALLRPRGHWHDCHRRRRIDETAQPPAERAA